MEYEDEDLDKRMELVPDVVESIQALIKGIADLNNTAILLEKRLTQTLRITPTCKIDSDCNQPYHCEGGFCVR